MDVKFKYSKIANAVKSNAEAHIMTTANQIYDEHFYGPYDGEYQDEINKRVIGATTFVAGDGVTISTDPSTGVRTIQVDRTTVPNKDDVALKSDVYLKSETYNKVEVNASQAEQDLRIDDLTRYLKQVQKLNILEFNIPQPVFRSQSLPTSWYNYLFRGIGDEISHSTSMDGRIPEYLTTTVTLTVNYKFLDTTTFITATDTLYAVNPIITRDSDDHTFTVPVYHLPGTIVNFTAPADGQKFYLFVPNDLPKAGTLTFEMGGTGCAGALVTSEKSGYYKYILGDESGWSAGSYSITLRS